MKAAVAARAELEPKLTSNYSRSMIVKVTHVPMTMQLHNYMTNEGVRPSPTWCQRTAVAELVLKLRSCGVGFGLQQSSRSSRCEC